MNWLNIYTPTLRAAEFIGSEPTARATWLYVFAYCAEQENGGVIIGARGWKDRQWQQTCGVTLAEVEASAPLLTWRDQDLILHAYPMQKEAEVQRMRELGSLRTESKALAARENGKKGGRKPNGNPTEGNPENPTGTQRDGTQVTQREPIEGEGEGEWNSKEKKKGTEEEPPEDPTVAKARQAREEMEEDKAAIRSDAKLLLEALNELTGKKFTPVDSHLNPIIARLNEPGIEPEECEKMLRRQVKLWKNDPKMSAHLVPSTLFRASNFQKYYDQRDEGVANGQSPLEAFYRQPVPGFTPLARPFDTQGGKRLMQ
jgi:uncharacterized phage protein (TIGR02220 family)